MSSSSGEDEDQLPQLDCGLGDTELVFMTEQLNRLRSREKRQKIAEARLTVTEAKLMEFAAKLAARKSKVEENHARLKNRKNRIREKEEKIRELESELNALDGEIKSKSDILKERETKLKTQESGATEKDEQLKQREIDVSEKLKQIEQRQRIVEKKETMIREMSQLLISQEMSSTRELNFHTRRFNRYGDERKHASDEEVYDTFSRSKSALDLTKNLQMASVWDVEYNNNNEINHGQQFALSQQNQQNMQQLLTQPHAKYEAHSIQDIEPSTSSSSNKKQKNGFQRMFANMKKSKSMDKLNTAEVMSTSRDIDMGSDSHGPAINSSNESPKKSPKNGKSKKGAQANGIQIPEPPMRVSSMDSRHMFQSDKGNFTNHQDSRIAQFNNPQFMFSEYCNQLSDNKKSVSWGHSDHPAQLNSSTGSIRYAQASVQHHNPDEYLI